jgi:hypothetical protein
MDLNAIDLWLAWFEDLIVEKGYLYHFLFGLALTIPFHFARFKESQYCVPYLITILAAAPLIEWAQYILPGRSCDFLDATASWVGTLVGFILTPSTRRRRKTPMRKHIVPAILLILLLASTSYGANDSLAPDGFFGAKFGAPQNEVLEANKDLNPTPTEHPFSVVQAFDLKTTNSGKDVVIQLDFFEKKLVCGMASVLDVSMDEAIKYIEVLTVKYGDFDKIMPDSEEQSVTVLWYFNNSSIRVTHYIKTKHFHVLMNDKEATIRVIEAEKKKNPKFKPEKKTPAIDHKNDRII